MKPRVAFFDFASCEGCQLQIVNLEEEILELVDRVEIVSFREAMKEHSDEYDIAFIEGSIQRPMDEERLRGIRKNAKVLVAIGACACTGGVNKLRDRFSEDDALTEVYGDPPGHEFYRIGRAKAVDEVVKVDFHIRGCPIRKEQLLYYVRRLSALPLHTNLDVRFPLKESAGDDDERSLVRLNRDKCILCRRCQVVCTEGLGISALGVVDKGPAAKVGAPYGMTLEENGCISCGACISACPVNALSAPSSVNALVNDLKAKEREIIAVLDSIALASYIERNPELRTLHPKAVLASLSGALRGIGFSGVVQYEMYISESLRADSKAKGSGPPSMLSWCKGAFNYTHGRIPAKDLLRREANAPWSLMIKDLRNGGARIALVTTCTPLKAVNGIDHVLSPLDLDDLLKAMEVDISFSDADGPAFDGVSVSDLMVHPGMRPLTGIMGGRAIHSLRIDPSFRSNLGALAGLNACVDASPCLHRCLSGGGSNPTVEMEAMRSRREWIERLWGVRP